MFVLVRTSDGKYVARPGSVHSYTSKLEHAQTFTTEEDANANRCVENERVLPISSLFGPPWLRK